MALKPKLVSINGTQLEYVETGEGSPIIYVHGHMSDYRTWVELFDLFSDDFRHIAYTQRYFEPNLTEADSIQMSVDEHIEDLCQFIEEIDCAPASLIGLSYGAGIALRAAAKRPDLVKSMVLYEPGTDDHILDAPGYDAVLSHLRNTFGSAFDESEGEPPNGIAIRLLSKVLGLSEEAVLSSYSPAKIQMFKEHESIVKPFFNLVHSDYTLTRERIEKIKIPTLMIGGELSLPFYAMGSDALVKYLPNSFGVTMKGVGHGGIALKPKEFVKKAESFIKLTADYYK